MSKIAFIYPGQGAQVCRMGQDFYEQTKIGKAVFDLASERLGFSVPELCFTSNEKLDMTEYTQAAMVTVGIAMTKVLESRGIRPDVTAGLSLGEYCALYAAGVMNEADAIWTVRQRGILMEHEVPAGQGVMAAILGTDAAAIEAVLAELEHVQIANYNCPGQIVISGKKEAVKAACEALRTAGARRCIMLNVSGPFHSSLLSGAGEKLGKVLEQIPVQAPVIPYVANVTAKYVTDVTQVKPLLEKQISSPVRWQQSAELMLADGVDTFLEIGPGKTLAGFMKKIDRTVKVLNIEKLEDVERAVEELRC